MPTAFVTGATGFLGLNVVDVLLAEGWSVVALHRPTSRAKTVERLRARGVTLAEGALDDRGSLVRGIPDGCDAVFHVAGNTNMWSRADAEQTRDNVDGTRNVVDAALEKKARRFIPTSTCSAAPPRRSASWSRRSPACSTRRRRRRRSRRGSFACSARSAARWCS